MLRKLMSKMMIITVASTMILTGCSSQSLDDRVNMYDDRYYESASFICNVLGDNPEYLTDYNESEKLELIEKYDNELDTLQNELNLELENYDKDSTEYKMFKSLKESTVQMNSVYEMINTVNSESVSVNNSLALGLTLATYIDNADKAYETFNNYVNELEIEIENPKEELYNPMDEVRNGLSGISTAQQEENKVKISECIKCGVVVSDYNQELCDHCLNYDNCADCGREKPKSEMSITSGKYHCGCIKETFNCVYCGKATSLDNCVGSDYCSNYCLDQSRKPMCANCGKATNEMAEYNYQDYCYDCYNSLMDSMYGPASVPEQ